MARQRRKNKRAYGSRSTPNATGKSSSPMVAAADPKSDKTMASRNPFANAFPGTVDAAISQAKPKAPVAPLPIPTPTTPKDWGPTSFRPDNPNRDRVATNYADQQLAQQTAQAVPTPSRPETTPQDQARLESQSGPLSDLPPRLQQDVKQNAILGGKSRDEYQEETDSIKAKTARMKAENDALEAQNKAENANMDANAKIGQQGQAGYEEFGSPQDAMRRNEQSPGSVDFSGFVQNAPVPEAIQQANAQYGQSLRGVSTAPALPPSLEQQASGGSQAAQDVLDRQMTSEDALAKALNAPSIDKPDMEKAAERQAERKAIGDQRRADTVAARKNGTTPEVEAQKREAKQFVETARAAEIEATQVGRKREALDSRIATTATQIKDFGDSYRALTKAIGEGGDDVAKLTNERNRVFEHQMALIAEQKAMQQELPFVHVPDASRTGLKRAIKNYPSPEQKMAAMRAFNQIHGDGAAEFVLSQDGKQRTLPRGITPEGLGGMIIPAALGLTQP